MIRFTFATVFALGAVASTAAAQDQFICHHNSSTFSVGTKISVGAENMRCIVDQGVAKWSPAGDGAGNCIYATDEYGQGALVQVDTETLICNKGIWYPKRD